MNEKENYAEKGGDADYRVRVKIIEEEKNGFGSLIEECERKGVKGHWKEEKIWKTIRLRLDLPRKLNQIIRVAKRFCRGSSYIILNFQ